MSDDGIRSYPMSDGWEILVGRTARDNDRLTLKVGKPADFWFHVAGMPGSHVIARHPDRPEQLPREVKRLAGALAVFFGKGKHGGKTAVHWTTCKHISKRRGAPPGQVQLKKFETLMVEPIDPSAYFGGTSCPSP